MIENNKEITWVFDLDDTLLRNDELINEMLDNLALLIIKKLKIDKQTANEMRDELHKKYGSTVLGLKKEYDIPLTESIEFIHQLSYEKYITPDYEIISLLKKLKGNKIVFGYF